MATNPKVTHTRADSAIDGVDSIPKTFATAQSFCTAVSSFASQNGVQAITELLQLLPQREMEIKVKDDTIRDLDAKSATEKDSHNAYTRKLLSDFEDRYDEWNDENAGLQSDVDAMKATSREKATEITALRKDLEDHKTKVEDLEVEHTHVTMRFKEQNHRLIELEARMERTQADSDARAQELEKSREQMTVQKRLFDEEAKRHQTLKDEAKKMKERMQTFIQFSVRIKELDLPGT
jgi:chromosome segregation ATPase